jgi:hypothetical protein
MKDVRSRDPRFLLIALAVFAFLAIATHRWVLVGRVPFAADLLGIFPPYASSGISLKQHSEIGDSVTLFYPWRVFQSSSLKQGVLPLWNPLILGGTPFQAEAQSALFYPFHLLYLILPSPVAWTVNLLLNMALAGAFTAWFVRDIGGSRTGAIVAGIVFSCCGFVTAFQVFSPLADSLIWLPFIFWAVHRLCASPSIPTAVVAAVGFALTVLAGHPETSLHVASAGAGFGAWLSLSGWRDGTSRARLIWFTAAGLLALGVACVQIIPTIEWVKHISLSPEIRWPARPVHEMLALVSRDITGNLNSDALPIPEAASYVAPMALLLLPLAFFHGNRRVSLFFALAIVVSLQLIWNKGPVHWIISELPVLARMKHWRVIFVLDFSVAVLAGLGFTVVAETARIKEKFRKRAATLVGLSALAVGLALFALPHAAEKVKWYWGPKATFMFLTAGLLLVFARLWNVLGAKKFSVAALIVLSADMGTFRAMDLPYARYHQMYPDTPLFHFLRSRDLSEYRIAVVDGTLSSNFAMVYGIPELGGYDVELKLARDFLDDFRYPDQIAVSLSSAPVANITDRRLDLLNVRYVVSTTGNPSADNLAAHPERYPLVFSDGAVRVFENKRVLSRARFLPVEPKTIEVVPESKSQLARLKDPSFDAERSVILAEMPPGLPIEDSRSEPKPAALIFGSANESVFRVDNGVAGLLKVGQIYYPGWRAYADGREVPVLKADFALVAIPLAAGTQVVRLVFDPGSFKIGLIVTLLSLLFVAILLVYHVRKTPRTGRSDVGLA